MNDYWKPLILLCLSVAGAPETLASESESTNIHQIDGLDETRSAQAWMPAVSSRERCLPIVSEECSCVGGCAFGLLNEEGTYNVTSPFGEAPLSGRIDRWCVDGECTEAFFVHQPCGGPCQPQPADSTCAFREGQCVTGHSEISFEGSYEVRWSAEGELAGTLTLEEGRYNWVGQPSDMTDPFHFTVEPEGRYTVQPGPAPMVGLPSNLDDNAIIATVNFNPENIGFGSLDRRGLILIRNDAERGVFYFHSVVSEFQLWRIEMAWPAAETP